MTIVSNARALSLKTIGALDYRVSTSLPLLECAQLQRDNKTVVERMLALQGAVSMSFGWEQRHDPVNAWLEKENLRASLTPVEDEFALGNVSLLYMVQWRLEALYALAWAYRPTSHSILDAVPDDFVNSFPSISRSIATDDFRAESKPRPVEEIVNALDLLYCLSSAQTDLHIHGEPDGNDSLPHSRAIQLRRHALEWLFTDIDWEDIELDT